MGASYTHPIASALLLRSRFHLDHCAAKHAVQPKFAPAALSARSISLACVLSFS